VLGRRTLRRRCQSSASFHKLDPRPRPTRKCFLRLSASPSRPPTTTHGRRRRPGTTGGAAGARHALNRVTPYPAKRGPRGRISQSWCDSKDSLKSVRYHSDLIVLVHGSFESRGAPGDHPAPLEVYVPRYRTPGRADPVHSKTFQIDHLPTMANRRPQPPSTSIVSCRISVSEQAHETWATWAPRLPCHPHIISKPSAPRLSEGDHAHDCRDFGLRQPSMSCLERRTPVRHRLHHRRTDPAAWGQQTLRTCS
jgi:hypothetical protein